MKKLANWSMVIVFFALVLIPLALTNTKPDTVSERENRLLANRPSFSSLIHGSKSEFIQQFEAYLNDNIGFREQYFAINNGIQETIGTNDIRRNSNYIEIAGKEGHFFFSTEYMIEKYQGRPIESEERLQACAEKINQIEAYLKEKEIPLYIMIFADKETIYPEYFTNTIIRGEEPIFLDQFTDYISKHTDVTCFNIKDRMLEKKKDYLLYSKIHDLPHYNEYGAFFSYQLLMEKMGLPARSMDEFKVSMVPTNDGDLIPDFTPNFEIHTERLDKQLTGAEPLKQWISTSYQNEDTSLPNILIMRDSYFGYNDDFLMGYLPHDFGTLVSFHYRDMDILDEAVDRFKPDYVVLSCAERDISGFVDSLLEMSDLTP